MRSSLPARLINLLAVLMLATAATAQEPLANARVRVLHALPGDLALTIFFDGRQWLPRVAYGQLTDYQVVPGGRYNFKAADSSGAFLDDRDAELAPGSDYTIVLTLIEHRPRFLRIADRLLGAPDAVGLRGVHLGLGAPPVEFVALGLPPLAVLGFGQTSRPVQIDQGPRRVVFRPGRDLPGLGRSDLVEFLPGTTYTAFLLGGESAYGRRGWQILVDAQQLPDPTVYGGQPAESQSERTGTATDATLSHLRVVHAAPTQALVAGSLNGRKLFHTLGYGQATSYLRVKAGAHEVSLTPLGGEAVTRIIELREGSAQTLLVYDTGAAPNLWLLDDPPPVPGDDRPRLRLVQAVPDLPPVDLVQVSDGSLLAERLRYPDLSGYVPLSTAVTARLELRPASQAAVLTSVEAAFQSGRQYTLLLLGRLTPAVGQPGLTVRLLVDGPEPESRPLDASEVAPE